MVSAVLRTSMLQIAAPEEMRGRMQGVFIVVVAGGPRLGDLRAGALASATVGDRRDGVRRRGDRRRDGRRRPGRAVVLAVPRRSVAQARPGSPAPESGEDRPGASDA